ncbi:fucose mutarotase isoform X2 [Cryptotermes secundus]|uniref:fucose mutarotase isoform X2 n=1 Tax=Cryptotermes secundus TaxID=105785 RepID=UPI001454BD25|nr:fucose mutarotase isoform X2 [Cryptotermes secundus]
MGRLKGIPTVLQPDLLHALSSMGHGDEIVLGDANFPSTSVAKAAGTKVIRADGHDIPTLLTAILQLMPLDKSVPSPVTLMAVTDADLKRGVRTPIWNTYREIIHKAEGRKVEVTTLERFAFYERAKKAYAIVNTGETKIYANIILKMGIIVD